MLSTALDAKDSGGSKNSKRKLQSPVAHHTISKRKGGQRASPPDFGYLHLTRYKIKPHLAMHLMVSLLKTVKKYKFIKLTVIAICQFSGFYSLWKTFALSSKVDPSLGLTNGHILVDSSQNKINDSK